MQLTSEAENNQGKQLHQEYKQLQVLHDQVSREQREILQLAKYRIRKGFLKKKTLFIANVFCFTP